MGYQVKWLAAAFRDLKQVDAKQAIEILNSINKLYDNPYKY